MNETVRAFVADFLDSMRIMEDSKKYRERESVLAAAAEYMVRRGWKNSLITSEVTKEEIKNIELEKLKTDKTVELLVAQDKHDKLKEEIKLKKPQSFTPETILEVVSEFWSIPIDSIRGKGRNKRHVHARWTAAHFLRKIFNQSYSEIGRILGTKSHTTIRHALLMFNVENLDKFERIAVERVEREIIRRKDKYMNLTPETPCRKEENP